MLICYPGSLDEGLGVDVNASVLAHHEPFRIGAVEVRPATKTLLRGGSETVVEPRVMQVLVALAKAKGDVVSRDDLVAACWDGRIVGDDAINRIMSRLRRLASEVGSESFVIETVTKVGYRLRTIEAGVGEARSSPPTTVASRRTVTTALILAPLALGGGWWWSRRAAAYEPSAAAKAMLDQALLAFNQSTREGQSQAVGILRQLVVSHPDFADAWGALGMAYAISSHYRSQAEAKVLHQRAVSAGRRATWLEPDNGFGLAAINLGRPCMGNWLSMEKALRAAVRQNPDNEPILNALAWVLISVGRIEDSLRLVERIMRNSMPSPSRLYVHIRGLWYAGRLDEADLALDRALDLYPTHFALWFSRFYIALYSGRPDAALAFAEDRAQRPSNIPDEEIAAVMRVAEARRTPTLSVIDAVMSEQLQSAKTASGLAENAAQFVTVLGRPEAALDILRAYYFGEEFVVPEVRFAEVQGSYTPRNDRHTLFLFAPSLAPLRRHSEFAALVERLGLEKYWRDSGIGPDYRRG